MTQKDALRNIKSIQRAINKNGQMTTITRKTTAGSYDPALLKSTASTPILFYVNVAPIKFGTSNGELEEAGTNTSTNSQFAYIAGGLSYSPMIGDVLSLDSDYRISEVTNDYSRQGLKCAFLVKLEV